MMVSEERGGVCNQEGIKSKGKREKKVLAKITMIKKRELRGERGFWTVWGGHKIEIYVWVRLGLRD
jgi:hypothetical protein